MELGQVQHATMPADPAAGQPHATDLQVRLALTLAARVCHDLAGTAGALQAAIDMAAEGQEPDALPLAQDCARELTARLRLLRAAFGDAGAEEDLAGLAAGLPGAERLTIDVSGAAGLDGARGRLAANLLLLAAQALPRGGSIRLSAEPHSMALEVAGPRAAWPAALAHYLADADGAREAEARPRDVGVAIVCLLAGAIGWQVVMESETRLRLA